MIYVKWKIFVSVGDKFTAQKPNFIAMD